ncbi:metal-dependent hydrolase [Glaciecola sp. XM2]|jgi:inner membrane protein|uniref:metal-dependent hydrolase n=1 Tax=Glaciecola sp. XM2 TaxID=1914931 RepID=UPI001BDEB5A9|nr:metal-dependent hydrolase [Glaciecola sp. XM2]MBT1451265.1 metal-dependent hydrolase [Glaciecola sp. XM2]
MDSLTQIALGGAVGYAVMGRKVGKKAILYGAMLGTLPDLDVFIPFEDPVESFTYHRSFSHSLFVHLLISPLIAWLLAKIHAGTAALKTPWFWMVFLCLSTHAVLDSFTVYGTQMLWPLTDYPFGVSNLFIIDPLVTLPLLIGIIAALFAHKNTQSSVKYNNIGLILSCVYMSWTLVAKVYIDHKVHSAMAQRGIEANAYVSTPAPFNTLLWRIVAVNGDTYYEGYASVFDTPEEVSLEPYSTTPALVNDLKNEWAIDRLKWFTKGVYSVNLKGDDVIMSDLRMGIECAYVFSFAVATQTENGIEASKVKEVTQRPDLSEINNIFARITDPSVSLAPQGTRKEACSA